MHRTWQAKASPALSSRTKTSGRGKKVLTRPAFVSAFIAPSRTFGNSMAPCTSITCGIRENATPPAITEGRCDGSGARV